MHQELNGPFAFGWMYIRNGKLFRTTGFEEEEDHEARAGHGLVSSLRDDQQQVYYHHLWAATPALDHRMREVSFQLVTILRT